jgi:hypothetical protein
MLPPSLTSLHLPAPWLAILPCLMPVLADSLAPHYEFLPTLAHGIRRSIASRGFFGCSLDPIGSKIDYRGAKYPWKTKLSLAAGMGRSYQSNWMPSLKHTAAGLSFSYP